MGIADFLGPFGWLVDPIGKAVSLADKYLTRAQNAKSESERLAWQAKADAMNNRLETLRSGERYEVVALINAWLRVAVALPFVIFLWKVVVYDKVWPGGATDDLSPSLWAVMTNIIWYLFGSTVVDAGVSLVRSLRK